MPRTNFCRDKEKEKANKRYRYISAMLNGGIVQQDISIKEIAERTDVNERTIRNRLSNPASMQIGDLYQLADLAGIEISFQFKEIPE